MDLVARSEGSMTERLDTLEFCTPLFLRSVEVEVVLGRWFLLASRRSSRSSSSQAASGGHCRASWDLWKELLEGVPEKEAWKKVDRD